MNPLDQFEIDNFKEILDKIEHYNLRDVEDKIIKEIVALVDDGSETAKNKLQKLDELISKELQRKPSPKFAISAFINSISGALSTARAYLL